MMTAIRRYVRSKRYKPNASSPTAPQCPGRQCNLPGTMALGVVRLSTPWNGSVHYHAEQDLETATVRVNLTKAASGGTAPAGTVSVSIFVSPVAPIIWTTVGYHAAAQPSWNSSAGARSTGSTVQEPPDPAISLGWTARVADHFYQSASKGKVIDRFDTATTATCSSANVGTVTRARRAAATTATAIISSMQMRGWSFCEK